MNTYPTLDNKRGFKSIYRVSDAQPNWAQTDPSQPDYIKNRDMAQEVRPINVNGEEFLNNEVDSGALNLVAGRNVTLTTKNNSIIISATGEGGGGDVPYFDGDDASIDFKDGILTLHGFENALTGSLPRKGENNKLEWVSLPEIVQGDGNKVTTLLSSDGSVIITKTTDTRDSLVYDLKVKTPEYSTLPEAYIIANDTEVYGAEQVAAWTNADGSYEPKYSTADSRIDKIDFMLEGIGGLGQPATVLEAIQTISYQLPIATIDTLGGIRASDSLAVDSEGVAKVVKVSTDILVQGQEELILNGGCAPA